MKKPFSVLLSAAMIFALLSGCGQSQTQSQAQTQSGYVKNETLAASGGVSLNIAGMSSSFKAMENAISSFSQIYPNCTIQYEYVQDYDDSIQKRLENNDNVDLFMTSNITASSPLLPYALELKGQSGKLDLSGTYEGLIRNFTIASGSSAGLYAVPMGGELRGMFVNITLLKSQGLQTPKNYSELMSCCQKLKDAGYVPLQGNPGNFGQRLMYPYVCSLIANSADYQTVYDQVNSCSEGVSGLFREPMSRLYDMVAKGYYNYKYVEKNLGLFMDSEETTAALNFLNITAGEDGSFTKKDDVGQTAFMPGTMSLKSIIDKDKEDYHSAIEYEFILSPVGDDGGYAYLSPADGIAINKNSANTAWALEFLNYLFSPQINKTFAADQNIISNTADAMDTIKSQFSVQPDHICQLGQVTFDYVFYNVIKKSLMDVSKGNNPKYMKDDGTMYDLGHYMDLLEGAFAEQRG